MRLFKTHWFAKASKKAHITDNELWEAVQEVLCGQGNDLGGGVFKKRLSGNQYRSIIMTKSNDYWFYEYLFAKKDRDNIKKDELIAFRSLSKIYASLTEAHVNQLLKDKLIVEVVNE